MWDSDPVTKIALLTVHFLLHEVFAYKMQCIILTYFFIIIKQRIS